jgi:microcystin degradation protein MlrC
MRLRAFGGGIVTETNVFSPLPTGMPQFAVARRDEGRAGLDRALGQVQ